MIYFALHVVALQTLDRHDFEISEDRHFLIINGIINLAAGMGIDGSKLCTPFPEIKRDLNIKTKVKVEILWEIFSEQHNMRNIL